MYGSESSILVTNTNQKRDLKYGPTRRYAESLKVLVAALNLGARRDPS